MDIKNIPEAILAAAVKYGDARRAESEAKLARDIKAVDLDTLVRNSGEKKPTENAISNFIKGHPEMIDAEKSLILATHALDVARAELERVRAVRDVALVTSKENV